MDCVRAARTLKALVSRALARRQSSGQGAAQGASPKGKRSLMIGSSPKMMAVYKTIASLQNSRATVLITGESGTGKELVARSIHLSSDRRDRAFVAVNCGALTETFPGYACARPSKWACAPFIIPTTNTGSCSPWSSTLAFDWGG